MARRLGSASAWNIRSSRSGWSSTGVTLADTEADALVLRIMRIKTHHTLSLDGFSSAPDGWPAITKVTEFKPKESHGIPEFTATTVAVAMGRTTFEPAVGNPWWPWPGRRVYVVSFAALARGHAR